MEEGNLRVVWGLLKTGLIQVILAVKMLKFPDEGALSGLLHLVEISMGVHIHSFGLNDADCHVGTVIGDPLEIGKKI